MTAEPVDLGDGHTLRFMSWSPDRALNPQFADVPDIERLGAQITHPRPDGAGECRSGVYFDTPDVRRVIRNDNHVWQVESWEPLTLSPSILCGQCGDHGFVRSGRWVRA